jgi:hypothetical protein
MPNWTIARYADPVEMMATDIAPVRTRLRERRVGTVVTGNVRSAGATVISPWFGDHAKSDEDEDIGHVCQPGIVCFLCRARNSR